jgi:glucose/arabinose dehydrogenase
MLGEDVMNKLAVCGVLAATVCFFVTTAWAQQTTPPAQSTATATPASLPPGSPLIGRPEDNLAALKLAPVPAPPLPAAANKIPVAQLKAPEGFKIELYASGMANARSLAISDRGTVFVGSRLQDKVYAITNKNGKREVHVLVSGLYRPNGVAFKNGTLYIAELSQISKIDNVDDKIGASPKPVVIYNDLPKDEAHGWKYLAIGPDNKLYFEVGQPGNNVLHDKNHGQLRRINLDGSGAEVIAYGIRNTVGFDWNPRNGQVYFTDNGRDWFSEDLPNDKLNRITKVGEDFGEPYCHQGNIADIEFGWGHRCSEFTQPVALLGPHAAALGMKFYTGKMFPAQYRDQVFIARHGSWNKTSKFGGDIALVKMNPDGTVKSVEPFITGFLVNNNYIGRPVDVMNMPDGSMLISDDWNGAVYRVSYESERTSNR